MFSQFYARNCRTRSNRKFLYIGLPLCLMVGIAGLQAAYGFGLRRHLIPEKPSRVVEVVENDWPKEAVELVEVTGAQSTEFPKGFAIKVKNISGRPIYFLMINVSFPEAKKILGRPAGTLLRYGSPRLSSITGKLATSEDLPIQPGATATLSFKEQDPKRFYDHWQPAQREQLMDFGIRKIRLIHQVVSFGDGTGYQNSNAVPAK